MTQVCDPLHQPMRHQQADFVFKIRRNIVLEGDLKLAEMELRSLLPGYLQPLADIAAVAQSLPQLKGLPGFSALTAHIRENGIQGYRTTAPLSCLPDLIRRLTFVQRVYVVTQYTDEIDAFLALIEKALGPVVAQQTNRAEFVVIQAIPHYAIFELSDVIARRARSPYETKRNLDAALSALTDRTDELSAKKLVESALNAQNSTSHLSHDVHYYKAKFFPRLARSALNICASRTGEKAPRVLDPFVGSGTLLLEAALQNIPSVGLDIDPLSVLISQAKLDALHINSETMSQAAECVSKILDGLSYSPTGTSEQLWLFESVLPKPQNEPIPMFPKWLMKNRNMTKQIAAELFQEIEVMQRAVAAVPPQVVTLFRVLMSDAISRKIRMRFLGTGVGRFSLTFAKTPMIELFAKSLQSYVKVASAAEWLCDRLHLQLADAQIIAADARRIPERLGSFDIIITSPPYLPASSGRESYAMARAPSLCALGLNVHNEVDELITDSIGSMAGHTVDFGVLTDDERRLVEWLSGDELRQIKAKPTARYFLDMRAAFREMYRVLTPGGTCVVVSGKQSTFYSFSKREVLYVAPCAELLAEEANTVGFEVEELCDVQLNKSNKNARPRSLDDYYETLIFLRKTL